MELGNQKKLLEKQKAGKKRMKMVGAVEIPQSDFVAMLKTQGGRGQGTGIRD
ncbi:MAG: hypothetical protein ACLQUW_05750 [Desulfobaccales bacterium]